MNIGEYLKRDDIDTYRKLLQIGRDNKIKLGDRPENLMKHRSYKRINRKVKQIK